MTTSRQPPAAYLTEDTSFPYGPFRPETPKEVYLAAGLASRLEYALRRYSVRYIAKNASLNPQTIHNLLNGESWPDLRTLARLEIVFNCLLWGYEHRRSPEDYYRHCGMDHRGYPKTPRNYLKAPPVLRHTQRGASTSRRPENPGSAYEKQINDLVSSWREEVYDGVLVQQVRPAVSMYAYASLQKVTDVYHVPSTFPLFSEARGLADQYGDALHARLSSACNSIRSALQAIQTRLDGYAAIATARRAHESLWQVFWLCNPA